MITVDDVRDAEQLQRVLTHLGYEGAMIHPYQLTWTVPILFTCFISATSTRSDTSITDIAISRTAEAFVFHFICDWPDYGLYSFTSLDLPCTEEELHIVIRATQYAFLKPMPHGAVVQTTWKEALLDMKRRRTEQ